MIFIIWTKILWLLTFETVKALQLYKCGLITLPCFYFKNVMLPVLTFFVFYVLFFCFNFSCFIAVMPRFLFPSFLCSDVKAFSSAILMWHSGSFPIFKKNFFSSFQLAWHLMIQSFLSSFFVLLGFWMEMKKSEAPSSCWLHFHFAVV